MEIDVIIHPSDIEAWNKEVQWSAFVFVCTGVCLSRLDYKMWKFLSCVCVCVCVKILASV